MMKMEINSMLPMLMMALYIGIVFIMAYAKGFSKKAKLRKQQQTFEDYMTGGKSRNAVVVALITVVTFYSGTTFTGRVGFFCNYGVASLAVVVTCSSVGVVMYFFSEKIWPLVKKYHLSTLADVMELRYQSRIVKLIVALITVGFDIIWLITEIRTLGYAMNIASGGVVSINVGSAIAFAIIILYVSTGGVASVSLIDSFSAIVMLVGSLIVLLYLVGYFFDGDWSDVFVSAQSVNENIFVLKPNSDFGIPYWFSNVVLGTLVMLVYPSNFMGICLAKNTREVKKSSIATAFSGIWLGIFGLFGALVLGTMAKGVPVSDPQAGILELCSAAGAPLLLGIVCTFVFAASLGTLDSTLISLSGVVSNDIFTNLTDLKRNVPCIGAEGDDQERLLARTTRNAGNEVLRTRVIVLILGIIAFAFSLTDLPLLAILADVATNGYTMVVPVIVLGLFWKKATPQGAIASMITTELIFIVVYALGVRYIFGYFLGIPLLVLGFLIEIIVSLITQKDFYENHIAQHGIFEDFFDKKRVAEYIRIHM